MFAEAGRGLFDRNLLLHRGERLQLVAELRRTTRHLFNQLEQEYLDACFAAQEQERRQKEAQQQREIQYAKDLALALERALTAARNAQSRQLAMHAAVVYPQAPMLALLLTQQAMCLYPTAEAMSMLQTIFAGPLESAILTGHAAAVIASSYAPDDSLLLTASMDKTARIWSADGKGAPIVLRGHIGSVTSVAVSASKLVEQLSLLVRASKTLVCQTPETILSVPSKPISLMKDRKSVV